MTSSDHGLIEELGNEPVDRKEHVRETEGSLHEMGEDLRRMGERLPHLKAQVDRAVDSRKGWPTGESPDGSSCGRCSKRGDPIDLLHRATLYRHQGRRLHRVGREGL